MLPILKRERDGVPATTDPNAPSNQPPKAGDWSEKVVLPIGRRSLLVPAWYRGVSLLMQTMGQMTVQYQRMNGEGGNFIEDRWGDAGRLNYLLQIRPNPLMTASQMQEQIEFRKIYFGNAFVFIERAASGWPVNLWLCTGGGYDPLSNTYNLVYNRPGRAAMTINAPAADVLHYKNTFLTDDFYKGVPTIVYAMKALSIAATGDEQALKDMAKGGKQKILVQEKDGQSQGIRGNVNKTQLKNAVAQFNDEWLAKDAAVLTNAAEVKIISQTAAELRLLETRGFQVNDIARILGVPRIMMMEDEGCSYKMPEHATQEFMLRTIQPRIRESEDELNSKLLTVGDFGRRRIHVCELALRRLDAKGQAEIDKLHLETGVKSPNELRNQYDLPNIPDGDTHYVSANLLKIGDERPGMVSNNDGQAAEGGEA